MENNNYQISSKKSKFGTAKFIEMTGKKKTNLQSVFNFSP